VRDQIETSEYVITNECASFLLGLLERDPQQRLSIAQALQHPFLQANAASKK
jgi:serine/threonine protein kinase